MSKILLIRHGLSIGNENGIIQGNIDFPLSEIGKEKIENIDIDKYNIKFDSIISSPTSRTLETSNIINKKLNLPIETDNLLKEVSAGILDGKRKKDCEKLYNQYYKEYLKRGDYNKIPNADTWNYNQARAITFLERYMNNDSNDIVVSHAAFMRCLINLVSYQYRNTQHDIPNCSCFLLDNPLSNIGIKKFDIARSSKVWEIDTYDSKYIMKRKENNLEGKDFFEKDILDYLGKYFKVPNVILMTNRDNYHIKMMNYLEGRHIFGDLKKETIYRISSKVYQMMKKLEEYDTTDIKPMNIKEELLSCRNVLLDYSAIKELEKILNDEQLNNYLKECKYILVHNDLHRSNILISEKEINILDFESVKLYPKELQLATYICSSYLLESDNVNIDNILQSWPESIDKAIVLKLIKYRLLYGMSFFDSIIKEKKDNEDDIKIREKYVRALKGVCNERNYN